MDELPEDADVEDDEEEDVEEPSLLATPAADDSVAGLDPALADARESVL